MIPTMEEMLQFRGRVDDLSRLLTREGVGFVGLSKERIDFAEGVSQELQNLANGILAAWNWDAASIPAEVSPLQAKIALRRAGFLEAVETAVASAGEEALIAYRNALTFRRDSPMLQLIAAAVPGLEAALDDIFTAAAGIEV
ncbi:hypothetical protein [Planctomyces sp. SH-PL14]|uniref:hypothetical protein n=1 Tax=Planctomyces sp. SH-PL14 TaxID=1632864 RepID=UPI00078B2893|nr:hypothetical protein [Planctomyces sp. SH-PL14]AMV20398.1 hypothetical protein VT03_21045 [Planctomyces sp. SH-PL14]